MDKNHLNSDFSKIDELFISYVQSLSNFQDENVLLQIREKIIVAFWKALKKVSSITPEMIEHTDVIVKTINYCIDKCSSKSGFDGFCKYTYSSVITALKSEASSELFVEKTGMYITDTEDRKRKSIEKAYRYYKTFNSDDKNSFVEYAVSFLGYAKVDLELYLNSLSVKSLSEKNIEGREIFEVTEECNILFHKIATPVEEIEELLDLINGLWKKEKDDSKKNLADLLTGEILKNFEKYNGPSEIPAKLMNYDFINKSFLEAFLQNPNYKLPCQQELSIKYKLSVSGVSVKFSRFLKTLKKLYNLKSK